MFDSNWVDPKTGIRRSVVFIKRQTRMSYHGDLVADLWSFYEDHSKQGMDKILMFWYANPMHIGYSKYGVKGHDIDTLEAFKARVSGRLSAIAKDQIVCNFADLEDPTRCITGRQIKLGFLFPPTFTSLQGGIT